MERWKRVFIRKLFHYDPEQMDIEGAHVAKFPHVPKRLYKYRAFNEWHKSAFCEGKLWTSSADKLNDPNECEVYFRPGAMLTENLSPSELNGRIEQLKQDSSKAKYFFREPLRQPIRSDEFQAKMMDWAFEEHPHENEKELRKVFAQVEEWATQGLLRDFSDALRKGFGILSLSADAGSELMWSHYSDSHSGFVIEYDFGVMDYSNLLKRTCFPVFYSAKRRDVTRYMAHTATNRSNNLFGTYLALIKNAPWSYEQEWRIVTAIGPSHATMPLNMPTPSSVILGTRCSTTDQEWMIERCKELGVTVRKVKHFDRLGNADYETLHEPEN